MDLRYYLATLVRRKWQILTVALLTVLATLCFTLFLVKTTFEATIYFTVAARDDKITDYYDFSNYYGTMASVEFARTLSGWHENPKFQDEVYKKAGVDLSKDLSFLRHFIGAFSVNRIERANVVVNLDSKTLEGADKLSQAYADVLQAHLDHYNQLADSKYSLVFSDRTLNAKQPSLPTNLFLALLVGLILGVIFAYLYEYLTRVASDQEQIERLLGEKAFEFLPRKFAVRDLDFLRSYLEKLPATHTILAGIGFDTSELTSKLSLNMIREGELALLVDADLSHRALHKAFKQTRRANKGLTDLADSRELDKNIWEIEKGTLSFLPVGRGERLVWEIFEKLQSSRKFSRMLIHTSLPQNAEVLNLVKGANLLVVAKLGETKLEDLQKTAAFLSGSKFHLVVLK